MSMSNELYHYGVLGMRWGIRRAQKKGTEYHYKSMGQKKLERRVAKYEAANKQGSKVERAKAMLTQLKGRDQNREAYARTTTAGRAIMKGLLMGPFGAGNYNRMRAAGSTKMQAFMKSNILASTLDLPMQLIITRDEEFKAARRR